MALIDNSEQESNYLKLANNYYSSGEYSEAYTYYMKVLEINSNNIVAVYMKGICAVYNSEPPAIRTDEYVQAVNRAKSIVFGNEAVPADEVLKGIEQHSSAMVVYWLKKGLPAQPATKEQGECISEFSKSVNVASLALNAVQLIYSDEGKEKLIDRTLSFINQTIRTKLQYFAGIKTDRKGRQSPIIKKIGVTKDQQKALNNTSVSLGDVFNNLPSRLSKSNNINDRLNTADVEINSLRNQLKEKRNQRSARLSAGSQDKNNPELKAEIAALDAEIAELKSQLGDARTVSRGVKGELRKFKRTMK
ncbi:MAG: hypothetical protein ACOX75_01085 [Lachnospiraceae bacterium]